MTRISERTVLFADLRGSTSLYETLGNAEATSVVTHTVTMMGRTVPKCDGQLIKTEPGKPDADRKYALSAKLKPGLIKYKVEFGAVSAGKETVLHTASNIVCGDAFLIQGQSNAVATDFGKDDPTFRSEWIRTFGSMSGNPKGARLWGDAPEDLRIFAGLSVRR